MEKVSYDLIVIGSGPGGYSAAVRAGQYGRGGQSSFAGVSFEFHHGVMHNSLKWMSLLP